MTQIKQYMFFNYFKEIIEIFGQTEVGCDEVDIEALANYLSSDKFFADTYEYHSEEEAKEFITNLILDGFPIWRYLKCSDWTKNMVEKSFSNEMKSEYEKACQIYKCLTCKHYKVTNTMLGVLDECTYTEPTDELKPWLKGRKQRGVNFAWKKECKNYEFGEVQSDYVKELF